MVTVPLEYVGPNPGNWSRKEAARRRAALALGEAPPPQESDLYKFHIPNLKAYAK